MAIARIQKGYVNADEENVRSMLYMDVIEYQGKLWFVPEWLDSPNEQWTTPRRLVRGLQRGEEWPSGNPPVAPFPVPRSVFEGHIPSSHKDTVFVIERPDIRFDRPRDLH